MRERLKRRFADGASAVEYGLLIALIAAVITATIGVLGTSVINTFTITW